MGIHNVKYCIFKDNARGIDFIDNNLKIEYKIVDTQKEKRKCKFNQYIIVYQYKRIQLTQKDLLCDYFLLYDIHDYCYYLIQNKLNITIKKKKQKTQYRFTETKRNQLYQNIILKSENIEDIVVYCKDFLHFNFYQFLKK
jgi:hypothetical protein